MGSAVRLPAGRGSIRVVAAVVVGLLVLCALLGSGGAAPASAGGVKVSTVATTTQAGYAAWKPSSGGAPAPLVNSFPHGTKLIGVFFEIDGGIVHKTNYQLQIKTAAGAIILGPVQTVGFTNSIHLYPLTFTKSAKTGVWTINILVNGKVLGTHTFTLH